VLQKNVSYKSKLTALRQEIKAQGLDGFIVPRMDVYQGEFVSPAAERLAWLTGFTGSAGLAIVLEEKATAMTDGRYLIQITQQVDSALYNAGDSTKTTIAEWLINHAQAGNIIGYDPWLHTQAQIEKIEKDLEGKNIQLRAVEKNPVDAVWQDRPGAPQGKVEIFPESIAGMSSADKRARMGEELAKENLLATILTLPDSIAWLLNIRGSDLPTIPVALSFAFISVKGEVTWFVESAKIDAGVKKHLGNMVYVQDPATLQKQLAALAESSKKEGKPIGVDFKRSPVWFRRQLEISGAGIRDFTDPCIAPKAQKTRAEQESIRKTHVKDGAALVKFLHWLDTEGYRNTDEIAVAEKLESFRAQEPSYRGTSFDTIAGFGAHGAIVHYRATEESNKRIRPDGILLLDSGGQYSGGTTDITRTIAIGAAPQEIKENFTRVLKGHIAVATAHFAEGAKGVEIDTLARAPLREAGLDYAHGTGHGVGCFLSVHEEAANISPRGQDAVKEGMLLSNEPGYYKEGEYGIRIENLVLVQKEDNRLFFETISLAPIDRALIISEMLDEKERAWLNAYHARVYEELSPLLGKSEKDWLKTRTEKI
jgi:Xaa-Pro aminopeptidase